MTTIPASANEPIVNFPADLRQWLGEMRTTTPPKAEPPKDLRDVDPTMVAFLVGLGRETAP